jgi:ribonuclease HII
MVVVYDILAHMSRIKFVLGIDEVGRGPLAGPVGVGVVAVSSSFDTKKLEGIRDSKKLSETQRNEWYNKLRAMKDLEYQVAMVHSKTIDTVGIVPAVQLATKRALQRLELNPSTCKVLLDGGLRAPNAYGNQTTIIKGDATEPLISAASILAKVTRDRYMVRDAKKYPAYGFEQHKGYGTKAHVSAIRRHGLSELHRETFCQNLLQRKMKSVKLKITAQNIKARP